MAYRIKGGTPLYGTVAAQGSKNAALPILFSVLLLSEPVVLTGVPDIGDVRATLALLSSMGVEIERRGDEITLRAASIRPPSAFAPEISAMRASSYLLGAGLSRFGEMQIAYPGGCNLGARPLNLHRDAFALLGAAWEEKEGAIRVFAPRMHGTHVALSYPSVGATVNLLLAAVGAEGVTQLRGYAAEPHVMCFVRFLRAIGADIDVTAQKITVRGKKPLHGCRFHVDADDIEAGTYLIAAAACGGEVTVSGVNEHTLAPLLSVFLRMGIPYRAEEAGVTVWGTRAFRGISLSCAPYPAFPTDLHPPLAVLLSTSQTGGKITDLVWRGRFAYLDELRKMGFRARQGAGSVRISPTRLYGAHMCATDLRGGAAMMIGALSAVGESIIENTHLIERGYEHFLSKWMALGARVDAE